MSWACRTMTQAAVAGYFLIVLLGAALMFFPALREPFSLVAKLAGEQLRGMRRLRAEDFRLFQSAGAAGRPSPIESGVPASRDSRRLLRHALIAASLFVLALPGVVVLEMHGKRVLDGYGDSVRGTDTLAVNLLQGEQLAPPPPLPPEVFLTHDVQQLRPALAEASRDWNLLDADLRQKVLRVFQIMGEQYGYRMVLLEGYRSPRRQDELAHFEANITNARAFQSYHQYGLAVDCAFFRDGKLVISEGDPWAARGYSVYGKTAESLGLTWGGRWMLHDLGHVELHKPKDAPTTAQ